MAQKDIEDIYALSPLQEGMLYHAIAEPDSAVYFEQYTATLRGPLDIGAFERAWQQLVDHHAVLRSLITWARRERPLQVVRNQATLPFAVHDWRNLPEGEKDDCLQAFLRDDRKQGFDLGQAPLMRVTLIRWAEEQVRMIWSFHHVLLDGWSGAHLIADLQSCYAANLHQEPPRLSPRRPYREYIQWLHEQDMVAAKTYWQNLLAGLDAPTMLQIPQQSGLGTGHNALRHALSLEETERLSAFARSQRCTVNNVVQLAWALLLAVYSGETDVLFGVTVSGRAADLPGVQEMVGLLINTLPMRLRLSPEDSVSQLLAQVRQQQGAMAAYEYTPLVEIQNWSDIPNDQPLFGSILAFENFPLGDQHHNGGLQINEVVAYEQTNFPLTLAALPFEALVLQLSYERAQFSDATIQRLLRHLHTALLNMILDARQPIRNVTLLSPAEQQQVVYDWNASQRDYPESGSIVTLFEAQVERSPAAVALIDGDQGLSYAGLNRRANQLARYLHSQGVDSQTLVGVSLDRSFDLMVALLGILKLGAAYVPLDPNYPAQRLACMMADAQLSTILTLESYADSLPATEVSKTCLDSLGAELAAQSPENPGFPSNPDDLFYVLYTSGSTGQPKGVMGRQRGAINRFRWMWEAFPFEADAICCHKTTLSFVDSVWEYFGPLLQGVPAVIIGTDDVKDVARFVDILRQHEVTRIVLVPSLLSAILDTQPDLAERLPALRLWVTSGETLPVELARRFAQAKPQAKLVNIYGSSEVAADATFFDTDQMLPDATGVPIGRPLANTQVYLLDPFMNPVPPGIKGEIYVGGAGIAAGYYQQPGLTAERFVEDPFSLEPGARRFKSGDFARHLPDGVLEYGGRVDQQIKIRGFRVELAEVEYQLSQQPQVKQAVVVFQPAQQRLVAFVQSRHDSALAVADCRDFLAANLPEYMVPAAIVLVEHFPLIPSGKVDRRALAQRDISIEIVGEGEGAANSVLELRMIEIWEKLLAVSGIGIYDNFFELGGHSLLAVRLFAQIEKHFQVKLPVARLFGAPTVTQLARIVDEESGYSEWYSLVTLQMHGSKPPLFIIHSLGGCVGDYAAWLPYLGPDQPVFGLRSIGYGEQPPFTSIPEMAAHYIEQIKSIQPGGSYFIAGYEYGGVVAFEVAQQLVAAGESDLYTYIINAEAPGANYRDVRISAAFALRFAQNLPYWLNDYRYLKRKDWADRLRFGRKKRMESTIWRVNPVRNPAFFEARAAVVTANFEALQQYQPALYPGPLRLFRTRRQPLLCSFEPTLGWQQHSQQPVQTHSVPGSLSSIIEHAPHASALGSALAGALTADQQPSRTKAIT